MPALFFTLHVGQKFSEGMMNDRDSLVLEDLEQRPIRHTRYVLGVSVGALALIHVQKI